MKKVLLFLGALLCITLISQAQPTVLFTGLTSTTPAPSNSRFTLNTVGGFRQFRFQANQTVSASTLGWAFHIGTTGSPNYNPCWRPYTGGNTLSPNTFIPTSFANGARYNTGGGGADGLLPAITNGNYYTFNVSANAAADNVMSLLETTYNPVTISSVTNTSPAASNNGVLVTVTTSSALSAGEFVYVRFSTNSYVSSTLVPLTFSGTTGTAVIPCQALGAVSYYIYSSNKTFSQINTDVGSNGQGAHDMATLNLNNNGGANYSYTQVAGTATNFAGVYVVPSSCYSTVAAFNTALTAGTVTGAITCYVNTSSAAYAETTTAGGISITKTGTAANTITFTKIGGNAAIFTAGVGISTTTDAFFKIIGADYITIDGFTLNESAGNITTTTQIEWGIALLHASTTDGAQNNTIQNCSITLNKTNLNTFGIYSNNNHSSTAIGTTESVTNNTTGPANNNKIYGNTITNVNMGIAFIGTSTAANQDQGNDIGGSSSATGNTITNWGGAAPASSYISNSGTSYCIFLNHQNGENVSYNTLTSATISGTSVTLRGIFKNYSTAPTIAATSNITNNTLTITNNFTSGTFESIRSEGMSAALSGATININNNTILNTTVGGVSSSSTLVGITNTSQPGVLNINGNIIRGCTSTATTGGFTGISNTGAVVTTININNNQIGNSLGGAISFSAATSGAVTAINNGGGASTSALTITGNDIRGIVHSTAGSSVHTYIFNTAITTSQTISSNTFTNLTVNTTGNVTFISNSVSAPASGFKTVNSNRIVTGFSKTGVGGTVALYNDGGSSLSTTAHQNNNNKFSNITVSGSTIITGWFNNDGTGSTPPKTITGNTFNNWSCGTGAVNVLQSNFGNPGSISNDTITNITSQGIIAGLLLGTSGTVSALSISNNIITGLSSTGTGGAVTAINNGIPSTTTASINGNTINNLSSTSTTATVAGITTSVSSNIFSNTINTLSSVGTTSGVSNGIMVTGGTAVSVYKNKIYDLSTTGAFTTTPGVNGIVCSGTATGATVNVYNNLIGDLKAATANSIDAIRGISITATGTTSTYNVYYNTVNINATSSGTNFGTSGIFHAASATATTSALNLRNNVIVNTSTPAGTGLTVAYRRSSGAVNTLNNFGSTSNNNVFFAGTPGASRLIYTDGTSSAQTLANYKAGVFTAGTIAPRDAASFTENPTWVSTNGSLATFLHINTSVGTQIESGGVNISGYTDDFDGDTRNATTPDIGADEFAGVAGDLTPPSISYTGLSDNCTTGNRTLTGVTIADASKVDNTATFRPRIYYRKNAGSYFSNQGTLTAGNPTSGTWSFTIIAADMSGLTTGDVVSYFVIAQDSLTTPNVGSNPAAGLVATNVNTVSTPPTTPSTYTVTSTLSGTYTVGSAGTYSTLDAAFTAYNVSCLGGAVTFSLVDISYAAPTVALNANVDASSTNTLTIKPTFANTVISGSSGTAVIKLNGADYVIIDGSISNGTNNACPSVVSLNRDLTISNTSNSTNTAVIWLSSAGTGVGATNNTIKNCILSGGVNQSLSANITFGIIGSGATIGTGIDGADNNTNVFENNRISAVSHGIYMRGAAASYNSGNIARQNLIGGTAFGASQVGTSGITMIYQTTSTSNYNEVRFVGNIATHTTNLNSRAGISLLDCTSSTVTHNNVHDIADEQTRGAFGISVGSSSNYSTGNTVANNMIYSVRSNGITSNDRAPYGIAIGPGDGDRVVNNSILMTGDLDPTGATSVTQRGAGIRVNPLSFNTVNLVLANNIVHVDLTSNNTVTQHAIILPALGANFSVGSGSGNNNYYVNPSNAAMVFGGQGLGPFTNIANLAGWQAQYAFESASDNVLPVFTSATDLHLNTASVNNLTFENTASVISGVSTDFDCDTRHVTTPDVGADEFTTTVPANDGAVTSVIAPASPCPGASTTISVTIQNAGSATLNTLLVDWTLNGVGQTQASYSSLGLAPGASVTLTLGSGVLSPILSNAIVATSSLPNGATDGVPGNDTFTLSSIVTSLTGTYTVGTGGDFTTITAAVSAYNTRGICGPTVFSLTNTSNYSAGETFPFTINAAAGASATNTLTIRPATGVDAVIQGQALTNTIFILNGADYVIIDGNNAGQTNPACGPGTATRNLTVRVVSTGTAAVIWLQSNSNPDAATNNTIRNCIIEGNSNTTTLVGIGSGNATISISSLATGNNNNTFENNDVRKVQYGIYSQGFNSGTKNSSNRAIQNILNATSTNNIGKGGIIFGYEDNAIISFNTIGNVSVSGDAFGISLGATGFSGTAMSGNECTNTVVNGNTIGAITASGTNTAIGILSCTGITSGWTNTISNNMISGVISNATPADITAGIALGGGPGTVRVYYNTVLMQGDRGAGTTAHSYALAVLGSTPLVDIQNNILVNTQTTASTGKSYSIGLAYTSVTGNYTNLISNNNDLFAGGTSAIFARRGSLGTTGGTDITTLAAWNTETGRDGASVNYSPAFTSSSDLHINISNLSNVVLENTGAVVSGVTTDFDCATRSATTPDMGADEFAIPVCSGTPTAGTTVATGAGPFCGNGSSVLSLTGTTGALGLTYQWQSSVTGTMGSYSDISGATSNSYNDTNISTTTWYQCVVTCTNSGLSAESTPVQIVVNPLPNVTVTPSSGLICGTGSVALAASGASTYTWSPTVGLSPTTGANVTSTVGATTTYTVTGTDSNGCTATAQSTVVFSPAVPAFTATATPNPPCSNIGLTLGTTVANSTAVIYNETFDGTTSWTALNNSTGGTSANAAWTQRNSGYLYSSTTFTTGDASPFMLSNSDSQGSGSTTNTTLTSSAIDMTDVSTASIVMNHYFRYAAGETARVQVSTDGILFTDVQTFTATTGGPAAFVNSTININAYAGLPTVYIRLQYDATWDWYWAVNNVAVSGNLIYNYSWSSAPTGFTSTQAGPTAQPAVPTLYSVTITNSLGCSGSANINVASIVQAADVDAGAATATTCVSAPISFSGTQNNTTGVLWTHNGTGALTNAATLTPTYTPGALDAGNTVTITLTGTANAPCSNPSDVISLSVLALGVFYTDADGDGFGNPFAPVAACSTGPGVVSNSTDCNDSNAALNPNTNWYADLDGDGYGSFLFLTTCADPLLAGVVLLGGDCNDANVNVHPGATELCQNGIDDDCDGTLDEGCSGIANDNWADAIAVTGSLSAYPVCTALNGTVFGADISPEGNPANVAVGGGGDVWYKFTSPSTGVQIKVVPSGFNAVIELQTSLGAQVDVENVNAATGGLEIMNRAGLTEGVQYWVGVRNYNNTAGGTFTICISPLLDSRCDEGPGTYAMCTNFKADYSGATNYTFHFTPTGLTPGSPSTGVHPSQIPLNTPLDIRYGGTYDVYVDANFPNFVNGIGGADPIVIVGTDVCPITIAAQPNVQVRDSQRCPATVLRTTRLNAKPFVCGPIVNFEYRFTEINCLTSVPFGVPFSKFTPTASPNLLLSFTSPSLVPGSCYNVEVRPMFTYGAGAWGTPQCIKIGSPLMTEMDVTDLLNGSGLAEDEIEAMLYPNPNNGDLVNLQIEGIESDEVFVKVTDGMGRLIYTDRFTIDGSLTTTMNFASPLSNGLYLVEIVSNGKITTRKMVVQK